MIENVNQKVKLNMNAVTTLASIANAVEPSIMVNHDIQHSMYKNEDTTRL